MSPSITSAVNEVSTEPEVSCTYNSGIRNGWKPHTDSILLLIEGEGVHSCHHIIHERKDAY